jgi:hypothetical protein
MAVREVLESLMLGTLLNGILVWSTIKVWRGLGLDREGASPLVDWIERLTAGVIIAAALIVLTVTVGGITGILDRPALLLLPVGFLAWSIGWWSRRTRPGVVTSGTWSLPPRDVRVLWTAVAVVLLGWAPLLSERLLLPPVAWDALTYHLRFPVLWLQTGSLVTSPAPFGDPSHAYFPLVGEMLLYWSMISTGTDLWSSVSQVPFAIAACGATAGLAMRMGAGAGVSLLSSLCWLATPTILRQTAEAMVDVELAAFFLCALYFAIRFGDRRSQGWLYLTAASLGLLVGTKYAGVLFAVGTLPVIAVGMRSSAGRPPRARAWIGAVALALSIGGYAYARNWIASGNPFLPIHVEIGSTVLLPGLLQPEHYYGDDVPQLSLPGFVMGTRSFLEMGPFFPLLLAALAAGCLVRPRADAASRTRWLVSLGGFVSLLLVTIVLPYRVHRFVYAIPALSWAVIAGFLSRWSVMEFGTRIALPVLAVSVPVALIYWGKDILVAGPSPEHVVGVLVIGARARIRRWCARVWTSGSPHSPAGTALAALVTAAAMFGALAPWITSYERARFDLWSRYWSTRHEWETRHVARADFSDVAWSWRFLAERTRDSPAVVAFAGTNLLYPLGGFGNMNRVEFVPRGNGESSHFGWGCRPPDVGAPGTPESWTQNLTRAKAEYLCVYRLPRQDKPARFPVEREWADRDPGRFEIVWERPHARVYRVRLPSDR